MPSLPLLLSAAVAALVPAARGAGSPAPGPHTARTRPAHGQHAESPAPVAAWDFSSADRPFTDVINGYGLHQHDEAHPVVRRRLAVHGGGKPRPCHARTHARTGGVLAPACAATAGWGPRVTHAARLFFFFLCASR